MPGNEKQHNDTEVNKRARDQIAQVIAVRSGQRDRALNEYQKALQTNDNTQGALDLANKYTQKAYSEDAGGTTTTASK